MAEEIRFSSKGMKKFVKYCYKYVLSRMNDTEKDSLYYVDTTNLKNIHDLMKEVEADLLYGDMNFANSYELFACPIKTAKEFFEQINENTIKQAWDTIPHHCGPRNNNLRTCEYLGYAKYLYYLSNKCGYYRSLMTKTSITGVDVINLASLIQTLDLPKQVYLDCLDYMVSHFDTIRFFDKDRIWERAKHSPKGQTCNDFCKQEICFSPLPQREEEGI